MILRRLFIIVILPLCVFKAGHASAAGDQQIDSVSKKLMDDMRKYFNTTDKEAFYDATTKYKAYCLAGGNMHNFYNAWQSEIIYDINFNHFFKAHEENRRDVERHEMAQMFRRTPQRDIHDGHNILTARQHHDGREISEKGT